MRNIWKSLKGESKYATFIGLAIAIVIAVAMVPVIVDVINETDVSTWGTDFTGGAGAAALFQLILLVFVAGIVIYIIREALGA